jgi:glycogen operon protein
MSEPVLRRRKYFQGRSIRGGKDVAWLAPDGREMTDEAWNADFVRSVGMELSGEGIEEVDEHGDPIVGDTLLILLNAHSDKVPFTLPELEPDQQWQRVFDTIDGESTARTFRAGARYALQGRSVAVFKVIPPPRERRRGFIATHATKRSTAGSHERSDLPHPDQPTPAEPPIDAPHDVPEPVSAGAES